MTGLLIVGAGGHGKVVADTASQTGNWGKIAFLDDEKVGNVHNWPIIGPISQAKEFINEYNQISVAVGNNRKRVDLLKSFLRLGFQVPEIIHPAAYVSKYAEIENGVVVFAQAAVNAGSRVGFGSIINTGAIVDHDCDLEEGVHLSPGVKLAGGVKVGKYSWIGIGASVIQQVTVGEDVVVGAGTVLIRPINDNTTVVGVPGKVIKKHGK